MKTKKLLPKSHCLRTTKLFVANHTCCLGRLPAARSDLETFHRPRCHLSLGCEPGPAPYNCRDRYVVSQSRGNDSATRAGRRT